METHANHHPGDQTSLGRLHRAEPDLLLVRLAADTGARRGELAALGTQDLDRRILTIERAVSASQLTIPKSGRARTLAIGASTADLWHHLLRVWSTRAGEPLGPWLFSPDPAHHRWLRTEVLGRRFIQLPDVAGVPDATLHRLRHSVATFLVARGEILAAQARLGHADAATTLREYPHATPSPTATSPTPSTTSFTTAGRRRHLIPPTFRRKAARSEQETIGVHGEPCPLCTGALGLKCDGRPYVGEGLPDDDWLPKTGRASLSVGVF